MGRDRAAEDCNQGVASTMGIKRCFFRRHRNRRLMANYEALAVITAGFVKFARINLVITRLIQPTPSAKIQNFRVRLLSFFKVT